MFIIFRRVKHAPLRLLNECAIFISEIWKNCKTRDCLLPSRLVEQIDVMSLNEPLTSALTLYFPNFFAIRAAAFVYTHEHFVFVKSVGFFTFQPNECTTF